MLKGLRSFILQLDRLYSKTTLAKVCKSYHVVAGNNNSSVEITSKNLKGVSMQESLCKGSPKKYWIVAFNGNMITNVQKDTFESHDFFVVSTSQQADKIELHQISTNQELIVGLVKTGTFITLEHKAKKDALTLILYQLSILMHVDDVSLAICRIIGDNNVVSIWYHMQGGAK